MGKPEDGRALASTALDAQGTTPSAGARDSCCCTFPQFISFRCVFVLLLAFAVLLSALFWLPIFRFGDREDLDLDYRGHDIVASFVLKHPATFLEKNISLLEGDIFAEMSYYYTKVEIISLEPAGSNMTRVVFSVDSDWATRSIIRELFVTLVTQQSFLSLGSGMFGDPSSFEILKFRGGIIISPPEQKAFTLQSVQILFNFTLNFSIDEILDNFDELVTQLKTGLRLAPYENLYISLINLKGSTVAPPTTVRSQVYLAVGIPSKSRIKQLAQTITGSHSKNLGLNNTVFGRVKQVSLSSILQHSLGSDGSPSPAPSPSPLHHPHHRRHHHHHHHNPAVSPSTSPSPSRGSHGSSRGGGSGTSAPTPTPAPVPGSGKNKAAPPPCHFGNSHRYPWKHNKHSHTPPGSAPDAGAPTQPKMGQNPSSKKSPSPVPASPPKIARAVTHPPSKGVAVHARPPDSMPMVSPAPSPSSAGAFSPDTWAMLSSPLVLLLL
ncbi:uncharacterized protein LOC127256744 [Andrographis paniculata]|uniref:uncharacterized protein LOC127256744 n=1 Tax=Andrographis paniculata TaxID=175694 RepID=UPI0021E998EA|nr:uncharacterized protein LOC127256744 [Andrographis paniculata]